MNHKMVLLVAVAGFLTSCSTPPVPDQTQEQASNEALSSYSNCVNSYHPYGTSDQCNYVYPRSGGTVSYNSYIYGRSNVRVASREVSVSESASVDASGSPEKAAQLAKNDEILKQAYLSYLHTASVEDLAEMSAQWKKMAAAAPVAP